MATYSAGSAQIDVSPSLRNFATHLKSELEQLQVQYTVDVDADVVRVREQLDQVARDRTATVRADVDSSAASAELDVLARDRTANIRVDDHGSMRTAGVGAAGLAAQIGLIGGAAGAAGGALGGLAVAGVGVGIAFAGVGGAIALGVDGIKQAATSATPAFDALKSSVSGVFASQMQQGFGQLSQLMGGITPQMQQIAGSVSGLFNGVMSTLAGQMPSIQAALGGVSSMVNGMAPGLQSMVGSFAQFGANIAPAMQGIGAALGQVASSVGAVFANLDPSFFTGLTTMLQGLAPLVSGVLTAFTTMAQGVMPALGPMFATLGQSLQSVAPALGQLGATLVTSLTPMLPVLAQLVNTLATSLAPILPTIAAGLTPVLQSIGAVLNFLGPTGVGTLLTMAATIKGLMLAVEAFKIGMVALNAVLAMNPIGLVVAALAALAAGVVYAYTHSETFRNIVQQVWNFVKDAIVGAWNNFIKPALDALGAAWGWLVDKARDMWTGLKIIWQSLQDDIGAVKDWIVDKWNSVLDFFKGVPDKISSLASGMWDGIKDAFKGVINWVIRAWNSLSFTIPSVEVFGKKIGGATLSVPKLAELATGGQVTGPGGPRSDLIPAMLSNGEYVINSAAVAKYGTSMFDRLNAQRFADGGQVGSGSDPDGLNPGARWLDDYIKKTWPAITTIGGRRAEDGYGEHSSGNAIDVMIPNYASSDGQALGAAVLKWLQDNGSAIQLNGIIWRQNSYGYGGSFTDGQAMSDRGSDTQNHMDHLHVILGSGRGANADPVPAPTNVPGAQAAQPSGEITNGAPATVDGQNVNGAYDPTKIDSQDGRGDPQKYTPQTTTNSTTSSSTPQSWGDVVGLGAKAFASGMVNDALGVFGIPTSLPPIVSAFLKAPGQLQRKNADGSKTPVLEQSQGLLGQLGLGWQPAQTTNTATNATPQTGTGTTNTGTKTGTQTGESLTVNGTPTATPGQASNNSASNAPGANAIQTVTPDGPEGSRNWLAGQLMKNGLTASQARGILAMNLIEGGESSPMSILGFTESQASGPAGHVAAFMKQWNDTSRRNPDGSIPGVDAAGNVTDTDAYLGWIQAKIVGQTGAVDWQGNQQPSASDYGSRLKGAWDQIPAFRTGGIVGGRPIPGFNSGGIVPDFLKNIVPGGGLISGPGGAISDMIPSLLSHGEYVINSVAAGMNLPLLEAVNQGQDVMAPLRQLASQPAVNTNQKAATGNHWNPVYQIQTDKVEDAFLAAQRRDNQDRAAQLANF